MDQPDGSQNGESDSEERIAEEQRKKEVSIRVRLANRRARKKASKNPIRKARPDADPRDDIMNEDNIIRNEDNTEAVLSDDDDDDLPKKSRRRKKKNDKEDDDEIVEKPRKKSKEQRTAERRAAREQDDLSNIATTPDGDIDLTRATMADIIRYGGWIGKPMAEGTDPNEHHMGDQEEITQLEREDEEEETVEQIRTEGDEEDAYAPQVTVTEDGRIIIDESSLYVDAGATNAEKRKTQNFDNINWDSGSKVNYESFRAVRGRGKWTQLETAEFFNALSQFGTDFSMIERLFPDRSRRQIKAKFKKEEKENPAKVNNALDRRLPISNFNLKTTNLFFLKISTSIST
eukprot:TRINITY_DN366_c0_g3_i5.p1 TRINITY_DN366_c0_g3~~TRINITY_DN366_c0_g3_i5.p1  ORF type:complete len:401 (-),score=148.26 TRINITY_DN366_c0_g3_i5:86-1123(-)